MDATLHLAVSRWLELHSQAAEIMKLWLDNGVRFGVFCSQMVWIAHKVSDDIDYHPDDIDILVVPQDFELAKSLLPKLRVSHRFDLHLRSRDKFNQSCSVSEAVYRAGSDTLQFMYPHGPIYCSKAGSCNLYHWYFSQLAFENCLVINTDHGAVSLAHPFDTLAFYGIMQRRFKNDLPKAASLLNLSSVWPNSLDDYEKRRRRELGLDSRVDQFIQAAMWRAAIGEAASDAHPTAPVQLLA